MPIAFPKHLTCRKGLDGPSVGPEGGQIFEITCLIGEVGPVVDEVKRAAKRLGEILEAIE